MTPQAYLLAFATVIYLGANLAQQIAIRSLGPTLLSAIMPVKDAGIQTGGRWMAVMDPGSEREGGGWR